MAFWKRLGLVPERKHPWRCSECNRDFKQKTNCGSHLRWSKKCQQRNGKIIIVDPNNKPKSRYSDPPARVDNVFVIPSPSSEPMMKNPPVGDLKMAYKQDQSDNMDLDAISDIQDSQSQSAKVGESKVIVNVNVVRFFSNSKR